MLAEYIPETRLDNPILHSCIKHWQFSTSVSSLSIHIQQSALQTGKDLHTIIHPIATEPHIGLGSSELFSFEGRRNCNFPQKSQRKSRLREWETAAATTCQWNNLNMTKSVPWVLGSSLHPLQPLRSLHNYYTAQLHTNSEQCLWKIFKLLIIFQWGNI